MCYLALVGSLKNLVHVDVDWDDEAQAPAAYANLRHEVKEWCETNLKTHELEWDRVDAHREEDAQYEFFLTFTDEPDMILFKMRWS